MRRKPAHIVRVFTLLALTGLLLTACSSLTSAPSPTAAPGTWPVDSLFSVYYQDIGGESLLGPAITTAFEDQSQTCQYFANALVCYNPARNDTNQFYLVSLGQRFALAEKPGDAPSSESAVLINGFEVYPDFVDLYKRLDQWGAVGQPLSNPKYDAQQGRVEQYFEKIGLVYQFGSSGRGIQLLPYGAYACDFQCRDYHYTPFAPNRQAPDMPFLIPFERLGGVPIFGQPLSNSYLTPDGNREQIFENVVIFAAPENLNYIQLRPLAEILGMITVPPGEMKYNKEDNVYFYPLEKGLGYHVPIVFDQFIVQHGGTEISGNPMADVIRYRADDINRQCYQNYCLEYHDEATESLRIRLTPLGAQYKEMLEAEGRYPFDSEGFAPEDVSEEFTPEENEEIYIPDTGALESEKPNLDNQPTAQETSDSAQNPKKQPREVGAAHSQKSAYKTPLLKKGSPPSQPAPAQPASVQPTLLPPMAEAPSGDNLPSAAVESGEIVLLICEQKPQIPAAGGQIIHLVVHKRETLEPVPGLAAKITVVSPNGELVYLAPPTGSGGRASIAIDPMPDVENGSLITYQVCINLSSGEPLCEYDSYLIWNYQ